jgi:hypothetical protein
MAGAVGMMVLGAIVAAAGVWAALVRANGGVEGALAAIGARDRVTLADAGSRDPDPAGPAAADPPAERPVDPTDGDPRTDRPPGVADRTSHAQAPVDPADDSSRSESPAAPAPAADGLLADLAGHIEQGRWREAAEVVDRLERTGGFGPDEAAVWRMALSERQERAELAGLP